MSQQRATVVVSFKAAATLSAYRIVKPGTANNQVALWDTATALMIGISQQDSQGGAGSSIMVAIGGTARVQAGASISAGACVTGQTATGLAIADTTNGFIDTTSATVPYAIGVALENAETNSVCEVLVMPRLTRFLD